MGQKISGTHQLLVYDDHVNMLGGGIYTIQKDTETLVVSSKVLMKPSTWSCLVIRMQDEVTEKRLVTAPS
jgi:hypothetical protein